MFITNADNKTHSTYSIDGENLFICKINASKVVFKTKIKYYDGKCCYSSLMSRLKPIISNISLKYYYYYFNSIITQIEFFNKGVANKTLDIELLSSTLKIPIPSLERQKEIVEYCEFNENIIKQLEKEIEQNKKHAHQFITSIVKSQNIENNSNEEEQHLEQQETENTEATQEPDEDIQDPQESEEEHDIVEYHNVEYIVFDNIMYPYNKKDGTKGEAFGELKDGKVKKYKK
jgi:hypothetical protein